MEGSPRGQADCTAQRTTLECVVVGAWRSLVAHFTGGEGVGGSNPLAPTMLFNDLAKENNFRGW